jgi:polyhydroxyalkanoate synthesis regulator protein
MQEQVRKNFATFERALGLFSPFTTSDSGDGAKTPAPASEREEAKSPNSKPSEDEIATLKAELTAMQQRLEQLSRRND